MGPPRTCFGETSRRGLNHEFATMFTRRQSTNMGMSHLWPAVVCFSVDKDLRQLGSFGFWRIARRGGDRIFPFQNPEFVLCSPVRSGSLREPDNSGASRQGMGQKTGAGDGAGEALGRPGGGASRSPTLRPPRVARKRRRNGLKSLDLRPEMARRRKRRIPEGGRFSAPDSLRRQIVTTPLSPRRFVDPASPVRYPPRQRGEETT